MIDFEEHFYTDDPNDGHPDVRTRLKDTSYFFLGNGHILAAIQYAPGGEGSPYGLLVMDPEHLGPKRSALTLDHETGLTATMLAIRPPGSELTIRPDSVEIDWAGEPGRPAVIAGWGDGDLMVEEVFSCPSTDRAELHRRIRLTIGHGNAGEYHLVTGVPDELQELLIPAVTDHEAEIILVYQLKGDPLRVVMCPLDRRDETAPGIASDTTAGTLVSTGYRLLDRFFRASCDQLPAVISRNGVVDASIWQYNREWVRDHSAMAIGLTMAGRHESARMLLDRLLKEFVSSEGDAVDSSERRSPDEVELDQNGELLNALETHFLWSGDRSLIEQHWETVVRVAEYPFRPEFLVEPPGLFANRREYWERHAAHGIETGFELAYQFWNIIGLESAVTLARAKGEEETAVSWKECSGRLKRALLEDPLYAMHDERGFIKRRGLDGSVQEAIEPEADAQLPRGTGLLLPVRHELNPDTSAALPIAMEVVDPASPLAAITMEGFEKLWNQGWSGGGYGRYNITSEADQPGSWPFPSLFVARAAVETGDMVRVTRILEWLNTMPGARSGAWFENYGERVSPPYPQVGIPPWMWAEIIMLVVHHILGVRPREEGIMIRPRLLPAIDTVEARLRLRSCNLLIRITRDRNAKALSVETDAGGITTTTDCCSIAWPDSDLSLDIRVP